MVKRDWIRSVRVFYLGVVACLVTLVVSYVSTSTANAGAKLKYDPIYFDCGEVMEGVPAGMTVVLENVGDTDLTITNVRTN